MTFVDNKNRISSVRIETDRILVYLILDNIALWRRISTRQDLKSRGNTLAVIFKSNDLNEKTHWGSRSQTSNSFTDVLTSSN